MASFCGIEICTGLAESCLLEPSLLSDRRNCLLRQPRSHACHSLHTQRIVPTHLHHCCSSPPRCVSCEECQDRRLCRSMPVTTTTKATRQPTRSQAQNSCRARSCYVVSRAAQAQSTRPAHSVVDDVVVLCVSLSERDWRRKELIASPAQGTLCGLSASSPGRSLSTGPVPHPTIDQPKPGRPKQNPPKDADPRTLAGRHSRANDDPRCF